MTIEFDDYGFMIDSFVGYLSLPWHTLIVTAALVIAYKIYRMRLDKW